MARFALVMSILLGSLSSLLAQNTGVITPHDEPTKDPVAVQLLAAMDSACGWDGVFTGSLFATGVVINEDGKTEPVIMKAKPGWLRVERPQSNVVVIISTTSAFGQIITDGKVKPMIGGEAASLQPLMFPFYTQLADPNNAVLSVANGNDDTVAGKRVRLVNLLAAPTLGDGLDSLRQAASKMSVAIADDTLVPLRISFHRMSRETQLVGVDIDAYLGDFRKIGGMLVPFRYEERVNSQLTVSFQFDNVVLNSPVAESDFSFTANN